MRDETAEKGKKGSREENPDDSEIEGGDPIQCETPSGEGPEDLDAGGLAKIQDEVEEGRGECSGEDSGAGDRVFTAFRFEEEEGESGEETEHESGKERVKIGAIESYIRGWTQVAP